MRPGNIVTIILASTLTCTYAEPFRVYEALAPMRSHYATQESWPMGHGWKPYKRLEWDLLQRSWPTGEIPKGAVYNAFEQRQRMPRMSLDEAWIYLGPYEDAGRATLVRFHPENPEIMFAGSASGGLFKSTDSGESWFPVTDEWPLLMVGSLAIDPTNPDILYCGTGEGAYNSLVGIGLLKSTDGGNSWNLTGFSWPLAEFNCAQAVDVDPLDGAVVLVGDYHGLYRSRDGAETFDLVLEGDVDCIVRDPFHPNVVIATLGSAYGDLRNGIYRSTDRGESWTRHDQGCPFVNHVGRSIVVFSPSDSNVVYAGISYTFENSTRMIGIYRSEDGGQSWRMITEPRDNHYGGMGWFTIALAVKPDDPQTVFSAGLSIYRTLSEGRHWNLITTWMDSRWRGSTTLSESWVHADVHDLTFHPDRTDEIWTATDGGIFVSTDLGETWQRKNNGFHTIQFYGIGCSATNPRWVFGGMWDNGTFRWHGERAWQPVLDADGGYCVVDFTNDSTVYYERQYGDMVRSEDGGVTRVDVYGMYGAKPWVTPFVLDPFDHNTIYSVTNEHPYQAGVRWGKVWVSHDRGNYYYNWDDPVKPGIINTWSVLGDSMPGYMQTICASPLSPGRLYVGSSHRVFRYEPSESLWVNVSAGLPERWASRVVADPHYSDGVFAVMSGYGPGRVFRSYNAGQTWLDISGNLPEAPAQDLAVDPNDPNRLYIGTDVGLFATMDGGQTWGPFGSGLPPVRCEDLEIQPAYGLLRVGTMGRGLWEIALGTPTVRFIVPNGGEQLIVGGELLFRWAGTDNGGSVNLEINRDYPGGEWEILFENTPNDGSELWIMTAPETETARFRISHNSLPQSDTTNADSKLGIPRLRILWPQGGEVFPAGSRQWVKLQTENLPGDRIYLYTNQPYSYNDGHLWNSASTASSNVDSILWNVRLPLTDTLRLKVTLTPRAGFSEISDSLVILMTVREPFIRILNPQGGETLRVGDEIAVQWDVEPGVAIRRVRVRREDFVPEEPWFWQSGTTLASIDCGQETLTDYVSWMVNKPLSGRARIYVHPCGDTEAYVMSGEFVIAEAEAPQSIAIPREFRLSAPHPNPFNPITRIIVDLPGNTFVKAVVFNRLGQHVTTIAEAGFSAGSHTLSFDGGAFATGLYFIHVEAGDHRETFKAVLLK